MQLLIMSVVVFQASGNKVSRQSVLCGSQNIVLNGKVRKTDCSIVLFMYFIRL